MLIQQFFCVEITGKPLSSSIISLEHRAEPRLLSRQCSPSDLNLSNTFFTLAHEIISESCCFSQIFQAATWAAGMSLRKNVHCSYICVGECSELILLKFSCCIICPH